MLAAWREELCRTFLREDNGTAATALHECGDASTAVALLGDLESATTDGELPFAELRLLLGALGLEAWKVLAKLDLLCVVNDAVLPATGDTGAGARDGAATATETGPNTTTGWSEEV